MATINDSDLARLVDVLEILSADINKCIQNVYVSIHEVAPVRTIKVQDITPDTIAEVSATLAKMVDKLPNGLIDQFWARALVRSAFAFIEAVIHELRLILQIAHKRGDIELSEPESAVLSDSTFDVAENGRISKRPRFIPIERNLKLIYAVVARTLGAPEFPSDDRRFAYLSEAVQLRNRLTHPKGAESLAVSFEEAFATLALVAWFGDMLLKLTNYWKQERSMATPNSG